MTLPTSPNPALPNPVLVEITRGESVESIHRGAVAIAGPKGLCLVLGDGESAIFPRSAIKPLQALSWVERGAAERLSAAELALAQASHSGELMHTERIAAWLARMGLCEADLACGPHAPSDATARASLKASGAKPTPLHNNCSGKHAGFLTAAKFLGVPTRGYEHAHNPVQLHVAELLENMAEAKAPLPHARDNCCAPNFALPLAGLALAMAKLADPSRLAAKRADAARMLLASAFAHPLLVAGTGRLDSAVLTESLGAAFAKTGAEGVYTAILPRLKMGIALKINDGATRAAETAIVSALLALGALGPGRAASEANAPVRDTRGQAVGVRRASETLTRFLAGAQAHSVQT